MFLAFAAPSTAVFVLVFLFATPLPAFFGAPLLAWAQAIAQEIR